MSDDTTGKPSGLEGDTDWSRLRNMTDEQVHAAILDDPEANSTDETFWKTAQRVPPASRPSPTGRVKSARLCFRPEIDFDPQNDDAIIWGDEGDKHFRLAIRRGLLLREYGLRRYFDRASAETIIKKHRTSFEKLAQDAYATGAAELIIG